MDWYYTAGGAQQGPVSEEQLKQLKTSGQLAEETMVWREGMSDWVPYSEGLFSAEAAPAQETVPVPEGTVDYSQRREEFLSGIQNEKIRDIVSELGAGPYQWNSVFPDPEKFGNKGHTKNKAVWLKKVEPLFGELLFPGEEILIATSGIFCSFAEQYFLGWMSTLINRTAFLFTNYRIIMIHMDSKNQPLQMKWHIPYDQVKKFKTSGLSAAITFKLKDNKSFTFTSIPKPDRKALKVFVDEMSTKVEKEDFRIPFHQCRDNLCPTCFRPVPPKTYTCENCQEEFIQPWKPAVMSLCLPCLGDFYLGHRGLGAMEAFGYIIIILALVAGFLEGDSEGVIAFVVVIVITHISDAFLTLHMAKKGLIPVKMAWKAH
ncbi:hypothetical protein BVX97_02015 [bacterium E08(2017)]|nr:hypothetical protein BVX97_02015 [bacterium E08(2017)]